MEGIDLQKDRQVLHRWRIVTCFQIYNIMSDVHGFSRRKTANTKFQN